MRVVHEWGKFVAVEKDGVERIRYNYQLPDDPEPSAPKPFCHPIRTPEGIEITAESPLDHFWHRGLWFTFKFVNGVNYWEERDPVFGRQVTLEPPAVHASAEVESAVRISGPLEWRDNKDGEEKARLFEERTLDIRFGDDGEMFVDWHITLAPREDVVLDRTPYTTWGGYGGVVVRLSQAVHKQRVLLADGTETDRPTGEPHPWAAIDAQLDTRRDRHAAVLFLPSPNNRRYPEPMYGTAKPWFNFFGPAPLFHEPLSLKKGELLRHACRVVILPRRIDASGADGYHREWLRLHAKTAE
ncbi:MAG TPA: DUF6807 family protein [Armatimonadaceae bacterium]|nr:DUF6807 family protein [Armatimonadaceae bacterium]